MTLTARADEEKISPNRNCCDEDKIAKTFPSAASSSDGCKRILRCPMYFPPCRRHHVRSIRPAECCVGRIDRQRHISTALGRRRYMMPSVTADGRTDGLAHKCLQTPLTLAHSSRSLDLRCSPPPPHITNGQLRPRVSTFADAVMIRKGGREGRLRSLQPVSFYELTNWGRRIDRPNDRPLI